MIELLYSNHYIALLRWCLKLTGDPAFAEDIVQEAFLRALANAELLETMREPQCVAWLYKTAKNIFLDDVRRLKHASEPQNEPLFEEDFSNVAVAILCQRLPKSERTLFVKRYLEGYNSSELGRMFGLPPATVRTRLASARAKLRNMLQENQEE